jgi:hypothetical protein
MALGGEILTLRVSIPDAQDHDPSASFACRAPCCRRLIRSGHLFSGYFDIHHNRRQQRQRPDFCRKTEHIRSRRFRHVLRRTVQVSCRQLSMLGHARCCAGVSTLKSLSSVPGLPRRIRLGAACHTGSTAGSNRHCLCYAATGRSHEQKMLFVDSNARARDSRPRDC